MEVSFTAADIAAIVQAKGTRGATTDLVRRLSALSESGPGDLAFLGNQKYKAEVAAARASVVLLPVGFPGEPAPGQQYLFVENPSVGLARVCARLEQELWPKPAPGIHPTASIAPDANIAPTATIGPLCIVESGAIIGERAHLQAQVFIGRNAAVGEDAWLMPGVILATECELGRRVRVQPGAVIGSDGFGYEFGGGRHHKVPQVGNVVVDDDVEIGANSTLDRARFSRTWVGEGTKIDNLVQVGHNVIIGRHCLLCGQAGVGGHITLGRGVKAGGRAGISSDVEAGSVVNGNPAIPMMLERRIAVLKTRLPDLFRRVAAIEEQLGRAEKSSS